MYNITASDFERKVASIRALFTQRHAHTIYGLVRSLRPLSVIEVGAYCGYLTCWVARALEDNEEDGLIYVIDDFSLGTTPELITNTLGWFNLANRVRILRGNSHDIEWPDCHMAIIDGDHSYAGCKSDYFKALGAGATCCVFHDTISWWGPKQLMEELRADPRTNVLELPFDGGLGIVMPAFDKPETQYTKDKFPDGHV